jgi:hypothetical protein
MFTMLVRSTGRVAVASLLSLAIAAVLASFPATALGATPGTDQTVDEPFTATSGDLCRYGQVKGTLGWHLPPPLGGAPTAVDVRGALQDRPTAPVTVPECRDDRRFSVLTVSAYSGGLPIDTEQVRADNSVQGFVFQLANEVRRTPIDFVVAYVCRHSLATGQLDYCGPREVFRAPVS